MPSIPPSLVFPVTLTSVNPALRKRNAAKFSNPFGLIFRSIFASCARWDSSSIGGGCSVSFATSAALPSVTSSSACSASRSARHAPCWRLKISSASDVKVLSFDHVRSTSKRLAQSHPAALHASNRSAPSEPGCRRGFDPTVSRFANFGSSILRCPRFVKHFIWSARIAERPESFQKRTK